MGWLLNILDNFDVERWIVGCQELATIPGEMARRHPQRPHGLVLLDARQEGLIAEGTISNLQLAKPWAAI